METSYKFRIYPTDEQKTQIKKNCGCVRFLYNYFVAERRDSYEATGESPSKYDQMKQLPALKEEHPWLKDADSTSLQAAAENVHSAYEGFFTRVKKGKKPGYPRFKRKRDHRQSYKSKNVQHKKKDGSCGDSVRLLPESRAIQLPKLGIVDCRISKEVHGRILSATVSITPSGKYFVSICCRDDDLDFTAPSTGAVVGIDLGLKNLVITSDGEKLPPPRYLRDSEEKLAKDQRLLSRKTKDSGRWNRQRLRVARDHEHIANRRLDAAHKFTTKLVMEHDIICMEDLRVQNMQKNHHLAKAIADAGWGEIRRQLEYKCEWYGASLIFVDPFFPSTQKCSRCGNVSPVHLGLDVREWDCPSCGAHHDRDKNAALNVLLEGLRIFFLA